MEDGVAIERCRRGERDAFRFNKGTEGRGKSYFSAHHRAEIARKLSHYAQLEAWMPDLMGSDAVLRGKSALAGAAS